MIIFSGKTLFNNQYNLMTIGAHILGLGLTGVFLNMEAHYSYIFLLFIFTCVVPLSIEAISLIHSMMNYRNKFNF